MFFVSNGLHVYGCSGLYTSSNRAFCGLYEGVNVSDLVRTYAICTYVCMHVCLYVCMYVLMDGWMDGDGWMCLFTFGLSCVFLRKQRESLSQFRLDRHRVACQQSTNKVLQVPGTNTVYSMVRVSVCVCS